MNLLLILSLLLCPYVYGDSLDEPTLTRDYFESASKDSDIVESGGQIIYYETAGYEQGSYTYTMHLYGNGIMLLYYHERIDTSDEHSFYFIDNKTGYEHIGNYLMNEGINESQSSTMWYWDKPPYRTNYLMTLRLGEFYSTIEYTQEENQDKPEWYSMVAYVKEYMEGYMVEENAISGKEYLVNKYEMEEIYGKYIYVPDYSIRQYVKEVEREDVEALKH